jgi:hypothetical protein
MRGDLNNDGVVDAADWKMAIARWWFYLAIAVGFLFVALVLSWWQTLTVFLILVMFSAAYKWATGKWWP